MARPRKTKEASNEDLNQVFEGSAQAEDVAEYSRFLEDLGDSQATVTIYRFPRTGTTLDWCENTTIDQAPLEIIKDKHGPGKYRLNFRGPSGYLGCKTVSIAAPYLEPSAAIRSNGNGNQTGLDRELLTVLIANLRPQPQIDMGSLLQGLAAVQPKPVAFDPATMLAAMVAAFTAMKPSDSPKDDMLEKLPKVLEIVRAFTPESKGEENLYTVAKDVGTKLIDAIRPRSVLPATIEQPTNPTPQQSIEDPEAMFQKWLLAQLQFLKTKANAAKDPAFFADYILDNDEEPGNNAILTALERGASFENLCQFDLDIATNPLLNNWFRQLYENLSTKMSTADDAEKALDTGRPGGNVPDPPAHAESGSPALRETPGDNPHHSGRAKR